MLEVGYTTQFKKDLKRSKKRRLDLSTLKKIKHEEPLPAKLKDHILHGEWNHHRELHVKPDWLLIYKLFPEEQTVIFVRTGSHSDLFLNKNLVSI